jgi:cell division protein FtsQ
MCWLASAFSFPLSSAFALREIAVTGNRALSDAEVLSRAGLRIGRPLLAADAERAATALLSIPLVRHATVRFVWPGRAVVTVTERSPVLALQRSDRGVLVLDRDGVPFRRQETPGELVPLRVPASALPWVRLGDPVPHGGVREATVAFASLEDAERAGVASLEVDAADDLIVLLTSGVKVRVGDPSELGRKMQLASEVMRALAGRGVAVRELDLRFGEKVVVRPEP